jgi:hypothetical protein
MVPRSERRTRGWPLTQRLALALSIGAFFVAMCCAASSAPIATSADWPPRGRARTCESRRVTGRTRRAAAGPRRPDAACRCWRRWCATRSTGRAVVLDRAGRVVLDTALVLGERSSACWPTARARSKRKLAQDGEPQRETLGPDPVRRRGGRRTARRSAHRRTVMLGSFDFVWFGLVFLVLHCRW